MKWKCTTCGELSLGEPVGALVARGWWIVEAGGGLCPRCARVVAPAPDGFRPRPLGPTPSKARRMTHEILEAARVRRDGRV